MTTYRRARSSDLGRALTFGGHVPPVIGLLLVLILVATVAGWVTRRSDLAALVPTDIFPGGELWRLVSWVFVQSDPLTLFIGGLALWNFGSQLVFVMGERRLLWTFLGLAAGGSVLTCLVARFVLAANVPHLGMWPVVNALLLMWSLRFPEQPISLFFGALPVTGRTFGLLIVFGTVLYGLAAGGVGGLGIFTVHFSAMGIAWGLSRGNLRLPFRRWRLGVREWWAERAFRRRSRHLRVVKKDGQQQPPRWMN